MSVLIFTDNPTVTETRLVLRELNERGIPTEYKAPWDIAFPKFTNTADIIYVPSNMLHRGTTFEFLHRLLILREMENNATIINPLNSMLNYSKEHLTIILNKHGIPHPETIITENIDNAFHFASNLLNNGREVVIKPICLARGIGVIKLSKIRSREM